MILIFACLSTFYCVFLALPKVLEGVVEEEDREVEKSEDLLVPKILVKEEEETPELKVSPADLTIDRSFFPV